MPARSSSRRGGRALLTFAALTSCASAPASSTSELDLDRIRAPLTSAEQERARVEFEEAIALCMRDAGFEYFVEDRSDLVDTVNEAADDQPVAYGYTAGVRAEFSDAPPQRSRNDAWVAALDSVEQAAYFEALEGGGAADASAIDRGCRGEAMLEVAPPPVADAEQVDRWDDMLRTIADDPRVQDVSQDWANCVVERDPTLRLAVPDDVFVRLDQLRYELIDARFRPAGAQVAPRPADADQAMPASFADAGALDAALTRLERAEIALYEIDTSCQDAVDYVDVVADVRAEMLNDDQT